MNLVQDPWLIFRVRQTDGSLVEQELPLSAICREDVIEFALPRADFQGAAYQFAIGLLQTVYAPVDKYEWQDRYQQSPSEQELQQAFNKAAHAFNAAGEGPLFMQDIENLDGAKPVSISGLLIEAPGGNGLKLNTDHFVKRGIGEAMSLPMAMLALFTLQINAPSGGQGHRTGLRGGGPLTTLVLPQHEGANLWQKLWLNVIDRDQWQYDEPDLRSGLVFPWLDKTRVSKNKGAETYQQDVHPLQMYWSMPRRIRLIIDQQTKTCELTGAECELIVTHYVTQNYGTNYAGTWSHPLTPYKSNLKKPDQEDLSIKGQPGGITYKIWDLLTLSGTSNKGNEAQFCAAVVRSFVRLCQEEMLDELTVQPRLWVFGYDMDNMKARGWYSESLPLFIVDADIQQDVLENVKNLQQLANDALWQCRSQVKAAWFEKPADAKGDFSFVDLSFWQRTEAAFYTVVKSLIDNAIDGDPFLTSEQARIWLLAIRATAFDLFDELALSELGSERSMAKRIQARKSLAKGLASKVFKDFIKEHQIEFNKESA